MLVQQIALQFPGDEQAGHKLGQLPAKQAPVVGSNAGFQRDGGRGTVQQLLSLLVVELLISADHARVKLFGRLEHDSERVRLRVHVGQTVEQTVRVAELRLQDDLRENVFG